MYLIYIYILVCHQCFKVQVILIGCDRDWLGRRLVVIGCDWLLGQRLVVIGG